jgi:hypothetical protein
LSKSEDEGFATIDRIVKDDARQPNASRLK